MHYSNIWHANIKEILVEQLKVSNQDISIINDKVVNINIRIFTLCELTKALVALQNVNGERVD